MVQGKVPAWVYFAKFEGYTEEEAKALVAAADTEDPDLAPEE